MAEQNANINVQAQGEEGIRSLANAFAGLTQNARAGPTGPAIAQRHFGDIIRGSTSAAEATVQGAANIVSNTIRAPFAAVGGAAGQAGQVLSGFVGPIAQVGTSVISLNPVMIGAAVVAAGITIAVGALALTLGLMRTSFRWAQESTDDQLRVMGRTRRTFPGLVGDAFSQAQSSVRTKMGVAAALFGEGAEALNTQITRTFTPSRMARGLRGDRDIFWRWGITPQAVQMAQRAKGERLDVTDWLTLFVRKRQELEARAQEQGLPAAREAVQRRALLLEDSVKLFGQSFADLVGAMTEEDIERLQKNIAASNELGRGGRDADLNAQNFKVELATTHAVFQNLRRGIGLQVAPQITGMMDSLNNWLLQPDQEGRVMGREMIRLGSALAIAAWRFMEELIRRIDGDGVKAFANTVTSWNPADVLNTLDSVVPSVVSFANILLGLAGVLSLLGKTERELWEKHIKPNLHFSIDWRTGNITVGFHAEKFVQSLFKPVSVERGTPEEQRRAALAGAAQQRWGRGGASTFAAPRGGPGGGGGGASTFAAPRGGPSGGGGGSQLSGGGYSGAAPGTTGTPYQGGGGGGTEATLGGGPVLTSGEWQGRLGEARQLRAVGNAAAGGRSSLQGVDQNLINVVRDAEAVLPAGYKVEFFSGRRAGGRGYHPRGQAVDVQIRDPQGNIIPSRGEDRSGMYRQLARGAYKLADQRGLRGLAWGGAFETSSGSGVPDLMHFDLGGERGRAFPRYRRAAIGELQGGTPVPGVTGAPGGPTPPAAGGGGAGATGTWAGGWAGVVPQNMRTPAIMNAINEVAREHNVSPQAIQGVFHAESKWNPRLRGGAGNRFFGLFQVGPMNPQQYQASLSGDPVTQIRAYGEYLRKSNFRGQMQRAGLDPSRMSTAEQAAYLQGYQFAPGNAVALMARGGRATTSRQAGYLGTTSLADMRRYFQSIGLGGAGGAPPAPAPATTTTQMAQQGPPIQLPTAQGVGPGTLPSVPRVNQANWNRFLAEQRPSTNIEDLRRAIPTGGGEPPPPAGQTAGSGGQRPMFDTGSANWQGLDARLVNALNRAYQDMPAEIRSSLKLTSGYRSVAEQAEIYARSGGGTKFAAAPPGRSRHQSGTAVDIQRGAALTWLHQNASKYGLQGIMGGLSGRDPVHLQLSGKQAAGAPAQAAGQWPPPGQTPTAATQQAVMQQAAPQTPPVQLAAYQQRQEQPTAAVYRGSGLANVDPILQRAAATTGVDLNTLRTFALIESGGKPSVITGSYKGLFQLSEEQFRRYGGKGNILDPEQNAMAAARKLATETIPQMRAKLGREPTGSELYLWHQQGPSGSISHIRNPGQPAWLSFKQATGNKWTDERAKKAIWGNLTPEAKKMFGSVENVTSAQFMRFWQERYAKLGGETGRRETQLAQEAPRGEAAGRLETQDELTKRRAQKDRENITQTRPPERREKQIKEGTAAGEAAAKAFKDGIKDVSVPVKSLTDEQKERDRKQQLKEQEQNKGQMAA